MKSLTVFFLLLVITGTLRGNPSDFVTLFNRFCSDGTVRNSRVVFPLSVRVGSTCEENVKAFKWTRRTFRRQFATPQSTDELAREGLSQQITEESSTSVQVFQFRDEADSYQLRYTFELRAGRWLLVKYEDESC